MATQDTVPPPPPPASPISIQSLILYVVSFITFFPAFLLIRAVGISSASDSISDFMVSNFNEANPMESQYRLQYSLESSARLRLKAGLAAAASFLATLLVPSLGSSVALGSPLQYWTFLAFVVFCGRYFVDCVLRDGIASLAQYERWGYYTNGPIILALASALHSAIVTLTWHFFGFSMATVDNLFTRYCAWLVGAWMIRCCIRFFNLVVLARWRANALYDRYEERILRAGFQFHIMYALIPSAAKDMSFLAPWRKKECDVEIMQIGNEGKTVEICCKVEDHIRYISRRKTTKEEVRLVAMNIQGSTSLLDAELEEILADTIMLEQQISIDDCLKIDKNWIKEKMKLNNEDARVLYGELLALVLSPDQVSIDTFNRWIRGAYKDNLDLGQTLRDGDNVILTSDRMLMALLINKAFLLWLIWTGNTTTQVLSVIAFVYCAKSFIKELSTPHFKMLIW